MSGARKCYIEQKEKGREKERERENILKLLNERWTNISSKELQLIPTKKGASPHCTLMDEIDGADN